MTTLLVLLVILSWGTGGIFDKKALQSGPQRSVFLAFGLFNWPMIAILLAVLTAFYPGWHLTSGTFLWELADSLASLVAILAYFYAMSKSEASYVLAITAGYPIVGALLAVPLLGEAFSPVLLAAAVLVSAGVAAIGFSADSEQKKSTPVERLTVLGCILISTTLWGLLGIFQKKSLLYGTPLETMLAMSVGRALMMSLVVAFLWSRRQDLGLQNKRVWKFSWSSAALVALGNISYIFALVTTTAGYMVVTTACYPLVMYVFALIFLKERLNWLRVAGIVLIVAGAGLTALA